MNLHIFDKMIEHFYDNKLFTLDNEQKENILKKRKAKVIFMATPNFRTSKNYPLIVNLSDDCDYYNYIEEIVEEFNDELVYHKVELLIGYYEGFQIYISSEITEDEAGNLSFINGSEIDNEEAHYWYDVNLTQLKRNFKKEFKNIL